MAALDKYLITKDDILIYRPTAELDDDRIKPFILEAQRLDLQPVLNDALYYAFVSDFVVLTGLNATASYEALRSGESYTYNTNTIQFDGVKPMLSLYALARFVEANPANITRYGVVTKTPQQSTPADPAIVRGMVNSLRSAALGYQNQVIQYLETKAATFPLYNLGGASTNATRTTSFNFFKG
jgi:hypothetical protein